MKIVVLKFGGTSVGSIDRIKKVANIVASYKKSNKKIIVVISAMSGETNSFIKKSKLLSDNFIKSEYDLLLSSGEQISSSLLAGRLVHLGLKSRSWMGWQIPILTTDIHSNAKIMKIFTKEIKQFLKKGGIPIIAGFQGINKSNRVTTLGRGASDYTAIMVSKFFKATKCIIYTDVIGVMTTDPKLYNKAKKIKVISYEEMLEMSSLGSKVMQSNSVQDARLSRINIEVKSSFKKSTGTLITKRKNINNDKVIRGISSVKNDAKITLVGVKDRPGVAASIFEPLYKNSINVDMVVQNISANGTDTDITFTTKLDDLKKTYKLVSNNKKINFKTILVDKNVSKVSIVGVGMITTPGVTYRMFKALSKHKINILVISTSEIKISVLIKRTNVKKAIESLHKEFNL
tara:strand:+ start:1293 stop:2501 length:1209 start_codon:yes stop_codon:yes gene_type:complete